MPAKAKKTVVPKVVESPPVVESPAPVVDKPAQKPSYTNRLCLHLLETFPDDDMDVFIDEIKKFGKMIQKEIEAKEKEPCSVFPMGKYKGKLISDVGKIDLDYIRWMSRQSSLKLNLKIALDAELERNKKNESTGC